MVGASPESVNHTAVGAGSEGAATHAAYLQALDTGLVSGDDRVILFNCGSGLKYPMPPADAALDHTAPIDWDALASA